MSAPDTYDQQPYSQFTWEFTHPGRLAATARLRGLDPPSVATARVLELGCASGTNLLPMAEQLPGASFVGLDRSAVQVAQGRALKQAVGVDNLTFVQGDLDDPALLDHPALQGPFDYVIAHGLYTWVSPVAQSAVLALAARLSSGGVAFLSADVLPGARLRQMSRDLLQCFDDPTAPVQRRLGVAQRVLQTVGTAQPDSSAMGAQVRHDARRAQTLDPAFLLHDRLSGHYHPALLRSVVEAASAHGLQFLGDALPSAMVPSLPQEVAVLLDAQGAGHLQRLQATDLVHSAAFRRILLTPAGPGLCWPTRLDVLGSLHIWGRVRAESVAGDEATGVEAGCLDQITGVHPASTQLANLAPTPDDRARVSAVVRGAWLAGAVVLSTLPSPAAAELTDRPRVLRLTRFQAAAKARRLVNAQQGLVAVDALDRALLKAMDGTRTPEALLGVAVHDALLGELPVSRDGTPVTEPGQLRQILAEPVSEALEGLVRTGFVLRHDAPGG
jgi:SAM-dependent methyltransferase